MTSEGTSTVPRMGSFQRAFLGYRRPEVDAAISARDGQISARDARIADLNNELLAKAAVEEELSSLSGMVIEREREIRGLNEQLQQANDRHDRSIASLDAVTARLQEIEAQARGQATRIRMKALREAVEVGRRAQELSDAEALPAVQSPNGNGARGISQETFEGTIKIEIGPLGDYSQLVGIEDAIAGLGASEISIERFSEGRATLRMQLDEPVDLLRELEERSPLEFKVRRAADDNLILDVDDDDPEHRAA
jgi:chromosome segregation ATPase